VAAIAAEGDLTYPAGQTGISALVRGADVDVIASTSIDAVGTTWHVLRAGKPIGALTSYAASPTQVPKVSLLRAGDREIVTAVLFPTDHVRGSGALPVVVSPYGGPHHSEVLESGLAFASDQWIADQGFAVVIADGRGTPARGPAWEKTIYRDFTAPVLEDQITALQAAAEAFPGELDLARVGIIGWSFGGWLAAYAVLARPDVFHAAVAGAPVTDWRLYDTGYTERYLGHPDEEPAAYERHSVVALAPELTRPLMIIHGLADDNVVFANALELSGALLAAGRPHTVLPLSGVTHMASQETVAENLLRLQVQFLQRELGD
jgi:dipeptidyl-peptidase-4